MNKKIKDASSVGPQFSRKSLVCGCRACNPNQKSPTATDQGLIAGASDVALTFSREGKMMRHFSLAISVLSLICLSSTSEALVGRSIFRSRTPEAEQKYHAARAEFYRSRQGNNNGTLANSAEKVRYHEKIAETQGDLIKAKKESADAHNVTRVTPEMVEERHSQGYGHMPDPIHQDKIDAVNKAKAAVTSAYHAKPKQ